MSPADLKEMEEATENAILDLHRPTSFSVRVNFDQELAHASLTATQRCVLASLVRTATLPRETLLSHLTDESLVDRWDCEAGNRVAAFAADQAALDPSTHALVEVMDWTGQDSIDQRQAEWTVRRIMEASWPFQAAETNGSSCRQPFHRAAPPGRLVSLLFLHLARVRSPSAQAVLWLAFCRELRRRWEERESLPNMVAADYTSPRSSTVGARATLAGQVDSAEPDPDDYHCLIGQKLQVFNLCLESVVASERRGREQFEKRRRFNSPEKIVDAIPNGVTRLTPHDASSNRSQSSNRSRDEFFDAFEGDGFFEPFDPGMGQNMATIAPPLRRGARCPVQGTSLANGDQLWAPYLQRPAPLTDDVISERRTMLLRQKAGKASTTIRQRLEVAHRLQRPKLLSDMRSFKAANPGAVFEDFVGWYGNPSDPLESYHEQSDVLGLHHGIPSAEPVVTKLDGGKAAEAIKALDQTRVFWAKTWEEADPLPADEQEALFDAESTVEMALDYLENIHPASLLCQVMAVNLATAYFVLESSAGDAIKVDVVGTALIRLRETVTHALQLLSLDVTGSVGVLFKEVSPSDSSSRSEKSVQDMMASIETIAACGRACDSLFEEEVIIARAVSLLHKLPGQYDFVGRILRGHEGAPVDVPDEMDRIIVLNTIHEQQKKLPSAGVDLKLRPAIREYFLQNLDDSSTCQLSVRYSDKGADAYGIDSGGLVLAVTKTSRD
jgi:Rab3 GTPase-activating protein catalytic subunit